jgi:hypothetical protein
MNHTTRQRVRGLCGGATGVLLTLAGTVAQAQTSAGAATTGSAKDPNPYYIGVSEALTHDSNVYRVPGGQSDNYSSTSLLGGFDQPISRQRIFGKASVTANRYQDQTQLNNVSYDLSSGLEWATIENISGNVDLGLNRQLAAPAATVATPSASRNIARTERIDTKARWGGVSLLTLEGTLGYSKLDYSSPQYVTSNSHQDTESLALYYRPGAALRLGVAGRTTHTKSPQALFDPGSGTYSPNTLKSNNVDLLADYELSALLTANARLSYSRQTNSSASGADFSGLTGSLGASWQPTGKLTFRLDLARDAGFDIASATNYIPITLDGAPILIPVAGLYENNRVTNTIAVGVTYAATAKINANAQARYVRARLATTSGPAGATSVAESTDVLKGVSLGANYAITRSWSAACNLSHEGRDVSGAIVYSYTANTVGCSTQFTWR